MRLNPIIIEYLNDKTGCDVTTPSGANYLCQDIQAHTGENISLNTIKRLTGIIQYDGCPRDITLKIVAEYLGFASWEILSDSVNDKISGFNINNHFIEAAKIPVSAQIRITWDPDRVILIRHIGKSQYLVCSSQNSKLLNNDMLTLSQIAEGYPFFVKKVIRNGSNLGSYTAAVQAGIKMIEFII